VCPVKESDNFSSKFSIFYLGGKYGLFSGFWIGSQIGLIYGFLSAIGEIIRDLFSANFADFWRDALLGLLVFPIPAILFGSVIGVVIGAILGLGFSSKFSDNLEKNLHKKPFIIRVGQIICIAYPIFYILADFLVGIREITLIEYVLLAMAGILSYFVGGYILEKQTNKFIAQISTLS
jgi:hypothetical protein